MYTDRVSQSDTNWGQSALEYAQDAKARRRANAAKQRDKFRAELKLASAAKKAAGLTQRVVHDRKLGRARVSVKADVSGSVETVNGVKVVVHRKPSYDGRSVYHMRISLPYVSILEAG